jgi:hypothetical protein
VWADTSDPGDAVIPVGGSTGQVLSKSSGTDYDTGWSTLALGKVLQVLSVTKLDGFTTTSTTATDLTDITLTITPSSASSKIFVQFDATAGSSTQVNPRCNLVRNSTDLGVSTAGSTTNTTVIRTTRANEFVTLNLNYLDSPNTTSAVTYKIQVWVASGTLYINGQANGSAGGSTSFTVMEIAA